jgi:hypothetical protein
MTKEYGNGMTEQSISQGTQGNLSGAHGNAGRTREERNNPFLEALRRQIECRAREKRIRGVQQAHD